MSWTPRSLPGELHADADVPGVDARRRLAAEHQDADAEREHDGEAPRGAADAGRVDRDHSSHGRRSVSDRVAIGSAPMSPLMVRTTPSLALRHRGCRLRRRRRRRHGRRSYLAFSPERSGSVAFWALALGPDRRAGRVAARVGAARGVSCASGSRRAGATSRAGVLGAVGALRRGVGRHARRRAGRLAARDLARLALRADRRPARPAGARAARRRGRRGRRARRGARVARGGRRSSSPSASARASAWVWAAGLYALALTPDGVGAPRGRRPQSAARHRRGRRAASSGERWRARSAGSRRASSRTRSSTGRSS